jgi:putative hydrolase of the HAD superfamily
MNGFANIQAVTFDVGGTLIAPWPSVGHVYAQVAAQHGVQGLPIEQLNRNFTAAWRARRNFQHTPGDWAAMVDKTFAGLCEPAGFFPALYRRFAEADAWRIHGDALPALDALASQEVRLGVISNWDERLRPLLRELRLDRYFEAIVISCEVAFAKPSPVIFEEAARKLGVASGRILHVGDGREEDVEGARSAGFQALLLDRARESLPPDRIASLNELELMVTEGQRSEIV